MKQKNRWSLCAALPLLLVSGAAASFSLFGNAYDDSSDPWMKDSTYAFAVALARTARETDHCIHVAKMLIYEGGHWNSGSQRLKYVLSAFEKEPSCFGQNNKKTLEQIDKTLVSRRKDEEKRPIPKQISNAPLNIPLGLLASPLQQENGTRKILQIIFSVNTQTAAETVTLVLHKEELRARISAILQQKKPSDVVPGQKMQQLSNEVLAALREPLSSKNSITLNSVTVTDFVVQPLE